MDSSKRWMIPLTGLGFFILAVVVFIVGGEPPDPTEDPVEKVVAFYVDNEDSVFVGGIVGVWAAALFVFFGGYLRRVLRDAEGDGMLSAVAFAGTIIFATGVAIDGSISIALADAAGQIDPGGVQALSALYTNDFLPYALGNMVFLLALGISVVRHGALPVWVGWIAIVLGIAAATPAGFFAFIGGVILVAVISVMLALRDKAAAEAAPPAPTV